MKTLLNPSRVRVQGPGAAGKGPVLYWMHRTFRAGENWGLIRAREQALALGVPVVAVFALAPHYLEATLRQFDFLLSGLETTARNLAAVGIPLILRSGDPPAEVIRLGAELKTALMVTDFDPLRIKRGWLAELIAHGGCPVHEVDSRNIVPAWVASDRREIAARTLRPKLRRHLAGFLDPFPEPPPHPHALPEVPASLDFPSLRAELRVDRSVAPVSGILSGEQAAQDSLQAFLTHRLPLYPQHNDPNLRASSGLSPYLHFGMLSSQGVVLRMARQGADGEATDQFIEELVVRRELADNFCLHAPDYDQVSAFPPWAQQTLASHREDPRPHRYSEEQFEQGRTHDPLWNAAQHELVQRGGMPGYLRMYWAKKILEWSDDASQAMRIAIRLNDRYALDGRESNGYAGIAWSIGGVHDRPWPERPIFGTIRAMTLSGARRKFDVDRYVRTWSPRQPQLFADTPSLPGRKSYDKP